MVMRFPEVNSPGLGLDNVAMQKPGVFYQTTPTIAGVHAPTISCKEQRIRAFRSGEMHLEPIFLHVSRR